MLRSVFRNIIKFVRREQTTKIVVEFSTDRLEQMEEMMKETGTKNRKDLINNAISFYKYYVKERKAGRKICSIDRDSKSYKEVVLIIDGKPRHYREAKPISENELAR